MVLAGDSAHVNSPIGGMGLNSGVHDAFNLADKLARIVHGEADEAELDRYERQRRHVAVKHTQAQTIRNKRLLEERDPAVRQRNHDELRRQAEDPALARKFLLRTALFESLREAEADRVREVREMRAALLLAAVRRSEHRREPPPAPNGPTGRSR